MGNSAGGRNVTASSGEHKHVYDARWRKARGTRDADILALDKPRTQVQFFYHCYNHFIAARIAAILGDCRGKKLLEIGCGRATCSIFMAHKHGMAVHPTDYSREALTIARQNAEKYGVRAHFSQADLYRMPFAGNAFDAVVSLGVMEHIEQPVRAYAEMLRLLKSGGIMISMNVPEHRNIQRIAAPANRFLARIEAILRKSNSKPWLDKESRSRTDGVYRSALYGREFAELVRQAGFTSVEYVEANPFPTFDPLPKSMDFLVAAAYRFVLTLRKILMRKGDPFTCSAKNSRMHFIVATKEA